MRLVKPIVYVGRFAPSPSGPLHLGSAVAGLASYLDAKAAGGRWLLRIEDIDTPRVVAGADKVILNQLHTLGLHWDGGIMYQSQRSSAYQAAFDGLLNDGKLYPCGCTRKEIADSATICQGGFPTGERPYAGTCRNGLAPGKPAKAWRLRVEPGVMSFEDRWCGPQHQDVAQQVGDFIVRRADGLWAYQLAVVVDDAEQGITDIVRGQDLLTSTGRQQWLASLLGHPSPRVMHVPLITDAHGLKLSKQNGAAALDLSKPLETLQAAWRALGFEKLETSTPETFLRLATEHWASRWKPGRLAPVSAQHV